MTRFEFRRPGADARRISIHADRYQVMLKTGKRVFHSKLSEIFRSYPRTEVEQIIDRRIKRQLDLNWTRKI